jgi:hypothetical protein
MPPMQSLIQTQDEPSTVLDPPDDRNINSGGDRGAQFLEARIDSRRRRKVS